MVAIADEISLPDLIEFDRWQAAAAIEQLFDLLPPLLEVSLPGQKGAGEIGIAPYAADDVIQGDFLKIVQVLCVGQV